MIKMHALFSHTILCIGIVSQQSEQGIFYARLRLRIFYFSEEWHEKAFFVTDFSFAFTFLRLCSKRRFGKRCDAGNGKGAFFRKISSFFRRILAALLEESGYSSEEALYAVENCGADWNEEAFKTAKELLSFSSFSKEALVFQLEIKGFTHEEALFGAEKNGY